MATPDNLKDADLRFPAMGRASRLCRDGPRWRGRSGPFRPQKPDGGSYHYVPAQLGVEVVTAQRGQELPRKDRAPRRRWQLTNRTNLPHQLGTNRVFTCLAGYAAPTRAAT